MRENGLTIYLAGKMGGLNKNEMTKWRKFVSTELDKYSDAANYKVNVISPCDYFNFDEQRHQNEQEVMKFDLGLVHSSDIVVVNTNGLNSSIGSAIEIYEALKFMKHGNLIFQSLPMMKTAIIKHSTHG